MNKHYPKPPLPAYITTPLLLLLLVAGVGGSAASASIDDPGAGSAATGQIVIVKIFTNDVRPLKHQDYERELDIYLPAAYLQDSSKALKFPVLYLLHGSPGNPYDFVKHGHWQIFLEQTAQSSGFLPPIIVAPDGNYSEASFGDSEWLNSADGENRFEDFIVDEVVPWMDKHYRTIPTAQGRTIGGVSEGGYGAVNIALHVPGVFGNVIALSGYYANDGSGWARRIMGHNKEFLAYNSPLTYINSSAAQSSFLTQWQSQRYFIGSGLDEKRYTVETKEIAEELQSYDIPTDLCQLDGKHSWELWNSLFIAGINNIFASGHPIAASDSPTTQQPL